jgi:hypothetical protein
MSGPLPIRHFPGQPLPRPDGHVSVGGYSNPGLTNPLPPQSGLPITQWSQPPQPLNWTVPDAEGLDNDYQTVGYWQSPLFDLRPEIRGSDGSGPPQGVPIWGAGGRKLWVQIDNLNVISSGIQATEGLKVGSREYASVWDPRDVRRVTQVSDVTADVAGGGSEQPPRSCLDFYPTGGAGPVRFWRIIIAFRREDRVMPPLYIAAAFY